MTATEVLVDLKAPPQPLFDDPRRAGANYFRFRLSRARRSRSPPASSGRRRLRRRAARARPARRLQRRGAALRAPARRRDARRRVAVHARRRRRGRVARRRPRSRDHPPRRRTSPAPGARPQPPRCSPATTAGTIRRPRIELARAERAHDYRMTRRSCSCSMSTTRCSTTTASAPTWCASRARVRRRAARPLLGNLRSVAQGTGLCRLPGRAAAFPRGRRDDDAAAYRCMSALHPRLSVRRPALSAARSKSLPISQARAAGRAVRRRHRVPAAQGPTLGPLGRGRGPRADLRAQGAHARRDAAPLSGAPLRDGRRQAGLLAAIKRAWARACRPSSRARDITRRRRRRRDPAADIASTASATCSISTSRRGSAPRQEDP